METINDIVINEFDICGYKPLAEFDGCILMGASEGVDYWLISFNLKDFDIQKELFDKVMTMSLSFDYIEKNLSLLLLSNIDDEANKNRDVVNIENDKSYFKKYVLEYNQKSARELLEIMVERNVNSISPLLQEDQCFSQLKDNVEAMSPISLLYGIAHKLPFIPIKTSPIARADEKLNLTDDLSSLLQWVVEAPNNEEIEEYINNSIKRDENE
jgi:hypothetical protein